MFVKGEHKESKTIFDTRCTKRIKGNVSVTKSLNHENILNRSGVEEPEM